MSEAVTNAEIEDVLSSIRRLVSENAMAEPQVVAPAPNPDPDPTPEASDPPESQDEAASKLVLTPAFRVREDEPEVASEETISPEPILLSDPIPPADTGAGEDTDRDDAPDALRDEDAVLIPTPAEAELAEELEAVAWAAETLPDEDASVAPAPVAPEADSGSESLENRIAELEAAIGDDPQEWEPDGSEDEPEAPQTVVFEHAAWSAQEERAEGEDAEVEEALVEEAEVVEMSPPVDAEPEAVDAASEGGTPFGAQEAAQDQALFEQGFEEAVIDEEVLREMVQRLVREELQGTVGERITRNVRRLVRREIQRALTLREFE